MRDYHSAKPLEPGLPLQAFRKLAETPALAEYGRSELERRGTIIVAQGHVRLAGHEPTLKGKDAGYGQQLLRSLEQAGGQGATVAELADSIPADRAEAIAEFYVRQHTVVRIGEDRYLHRSAVDALTSRTVAHLREAGEASPAELRDILGLTRKYLIPVLGWLDAQGITVRSGDVRRLGPKASQVSGLD